MKISFLFRVLFGFSTLASLYVAPWWLTIILAVIGVVFFRMYEMVLLGILLDALYPQELFSFVHTGYLFTSVLLLAVSASWIISKEMRIPND